MTRITLLLAFAVAGCSSTTALTSQAPVNPVSIDAQVTEWESALRPVEGEEFSMGVLNDDTSLYIALVTHNQQVLRQILVTGLTFWLDPEGGKERTVGLRFPLGIEIEEPPMRGANEGNLGGRMRRVIEQTTGHFEVTQGDIVAKYPAGSIPDIATSASVDYGTLTLEVQVPLHATEEFPISATEADALGLGLETPSIDLSDLRQDLGGGMGLGGRNGGGIGGDRIGRGGRSGGVGGGQRLRRGSSTLPSPLKFWTTVTLAR